MSQRGRKMDKIIPPFHGTMWMPFLRIMFKSCWSNSRFSQTAETMCFPSFGRFSTMGTQHGNTMVTNPDRCSILGSTGTRYHYAWPDKGHSTKTTRSCGNSNDLAKVMSKCHGRGLEELGLWILAAGGKYSVRIGEVQVKRWIFEVMESMFFSGSYCTFWVKGGHRLEHFYSVMCMGSNYLTTKMYPSIPNKC